MCGHMWVCMCARACGGGVLGLLSLEHTGEVARLNPGFDVAGAADGGTTQRRANQRDDKALQMRSRES